MAKSNKGVITGTEGNDLLKGDHTDGDTFYGYGGNDTVRALGGNDFIFAGSGNDIIYAAGGNDLIIAGAGDDYVNGGAGVDSLLYTEAFSAITVDLAITTAQDTGGDGIDTLISIENIVGSLYDDHIFGSSAANTLNGGNGNDVIDGRAGIDTLSGGAGNDTVLGGLGNDLIYAGEGGASDIDIYDGGGGIDTLEYIWAPGLAGVTVNLAITVAQDTGAAGINTITGIENLSGTQRDDTLTGNAIANKLFGGAGNDTINGMAGNDTLDGFTGSDIVNGGAGNDIISGGMIGAIGEHDILTGGTGADTFVFANVGYSRVDSVDLITDFSAAQGDRIDMRNNTFFLPQTFIGTAEFSNVAGQIRVAAGPGGLQYVEADYDANGVADLRIEVVSATALATTDFII